MSQFLYCCLGSWDFMVLVPLLRFLFLLLETRVSVQGFQGTFCIFLIFVLFCWLDFSPLSSIIHLVTLWKVLESVLLCTSINKIWEPVAYLLIAAKSQFGSYMLCLIHYSSTWMILNIMIVCHSSSSTWWLSNPSYLLICKKGTISIKISNFFGCQKKLTDIPLCNKSKVCWMNCWATGRCRELLEVG